MSKLSILTRPRNILVIRILLLTLFLNFYRIQPMYSQNEINEYRVSIIYSGKSLGALGKFRSQEEHELLTEQAIKEGNSIKLISHACWRAPGLTAFLPSDEPIGNELSLILDSLPFAQKIDNIPALISKNVLLIQDPKKPDPDLFTLLFRNPRQPIEFPDLKHVTVTIYRLPNVGDKGAIIVEESGAIWPRHQSEWQIGEMNRIDIGKNGRLYELPFNLGGMGSRSTALSQMINETKPFTDQVIIIDLGHMDGDLGVERKDRAQIDFTVLSKLGYNLSLPYSFELSLGAKGFKEIRDSFKLEFLATNIKSKDSSLFKNYLVYESGPVKLGFIGLIDPRIKNDLPRNILEDFSFVPINGAAQKAVDTLRRLGVNVVVCLTNMETSDNAILSESVTGIDVIIADLNPSLTPEFLDTEIKFSETNQPRPGPPRLIARSLAHGLGLAKLDLTFKSVPEGSKSELTRVSHLLSSITDRIPPDTTLLREIKEMSNLVERPQGDLMFPAFIDLIEQIPELQNFDNITQQGRISKQMWEEFVARLLRLKGPAEVAIIRQFPNFPPLIGKLHEKEVRNWLWAEDEIVFFDLKGGDLRKVLERDIENELITSGIDRKNWKIMGREIISDATYRIATTDIVFEGARSEFFQDTRRIRRNFTIDSNGLLINDPEAATLTLRDFTLNELKLIRSLGSGKEYHARIAELVKPDPPYERLITFNFDRPTFYLTYIKKYNDEGYGSVPESRIISPEALIMGVNGKFVATYDTPNAALDFGLSLAYGRQSFTIDESKNTSESVDDLKFDLTWRKKKSNRWYQIFLRTLFDTEFTPTENPSTGEYNPRQLALSGVVGLTKLKPSKWRVLELGIASQQNFGIGHFQYGFQGCAYGRWPIGKDSRISYSLRNDAAYFIKRSSDSESELAFRYNMVHELLIPIVDEFSLSLALDMFFYQGRTEVTSKPGLSNLVRIGITYDRLWKPRYQPLL